MRASVPVTLEKRKYITGKTIKATSAAMATDKMIIFIIWPPIKKR